MILLPFSGICKIFIPVCEMTHKYSGKLSNYPVLWIGRAETMPQMGERAACRTAAPSHHSLGMGLSAEALRYGG